MNALDSFVKRFKAEGWGWNLYWTFCWVRFSHNLTSDVLWYASLPRKFVVIFSLSLILSLAWLFRPWLELEGENP